MNRYKVLKRFLVWRLRHVNDRQFLMIMSILVGFLVGIAAVIIKNSVHFIQHLLTSNFTQDDGHYLYLTFPIIGILIAVLFIKYVIRGHVGHGIPSVLFAISKTNGVIKRHNIFSSVFTSTFTVGFGGSVGLEGPTVATGAAIGSNLGRLFHLNYKQIMLLLGVACAASMAAIFKSPIAAIVFATEVIMIDLTMASAVPLLLASVTAVLTSYFFLGQAVLYPANITEAFLLKDIPFYILLGIMAGLVSVYFTKMYIFIESRFSKIKNWYSKLITGGLILGVLIFFFPALFGEGYEAVNATLQGDVSPLYNNSIFYSFKDKIGVIFLLFIFIILLKAIATAVTFGAGGIGGIFAPTLFMGAFTGLFFAKLINYFEIGTIMESNFALVGMGGLIAGVLHGPLTAIFLIAELTGGYELFVPLMITATISYATIKMFVPNSVYTYQLAKRGQLITHHKDRAVLSMMRVDRLIERNFKTIGLNSTLGDLIKVVSQSSRNIFPITDDKGVFIGVVTLEEIREIMFKPELYDTTYVKDLMFVPDVIVDYNESMEDVAKKFRITDRFNMIVTREGKFEGCISRAKVFSKYRSLQKFFSDD
ncbi:MAG: chloride channel protein [Bacteroidetes bacterium]|nr:chloride channel protein [Bacteroidota bacterium]